MRAFWYVSPQKLDALSVERRTWFRRLSSFKFGFTPVSVEVGLEGGKASPRLLTAVERLEKRLRETHSVIGVENVSKGGAVTYFEYQGPSARVVSKGVFYVAAISNMHGVLLAGSAANAIGAPAGNQGRPLHGSADPLGAVKQLFASHGHQDAVAELEEADEGRAYRDPTPLPGPPGFIGFVHSLILRESGVALESLPHTRGIALYAGRHDVPRGAQYYDPISTSIVVGSPLWVEQIVGDQRAVSESGL